MDTCGSGEPSPASYQLFLKPRELPRQRAVEHDAANMSDNAAEN